MSHNYGRFAGDGRRAITSKILKTLPSADYYSVPTFIARMFIDMFEGKGASDHSAQGGTIWVLAEYCEANDIPYEIREFKLDSMPGKVLGYQIRKRGKSEKQGADSV